MEQSQNNNLAFFRLLSEQEQDEVLVDCVNTLGLAKDLAAERLDSAEAYHASERKGSKIRLGLTALGATLTCVFLETLDPVVHTGVYTKVGVITGLILVGGMWNIEYGKSLGRRQVSQQLQFEHSQLAEFYQVALDRAVNKSIIEPTTEQP